MDPGGKYYPVWGVGVWCYAVCDLGVMCYEVFDLGVMCYVVYSPLWSVLVVYFFLLLDDACKVVVSLEVWFVDDEAHWFV